MAATRTQDRVDRPLAWAAATLALWTACPLALGQSLLGSLSVSSPGPVSINIQQTGSARLGTPTQPVIVDSAGTGEVTLKVVQVAGDTPPATARVEIHTQGTVPTRVTLRQETPAQGSVGNVFASLLLGTQSAGIGHNVTLLQQGSDASGSLELTSGDYLRAHLVQGAGSTLGIATSGSYSVFGTATQPFTVAQDSTVHITNQGNSNTYWIATQASGDSLSLHVKGNGNTFNFDFPLAGADAYKALSWGQSSAPAEVNGGNFAVARFGSPGSYFYAVYDATNTNAVQAASAVVTPR